MKLKHLVPRKLREKWRLNRLRKEILAYYKRIEKTTDEEKIALNFLKGLNVFTISSIKLIFPYKFINKYRKQPVKINYDGKLLLYYVEHCGKKLYFPREMKLEKIQDYYRGICLEQDSSSPHCYLNTNFQVKEGDVCLDIGCAEGNFALEIVEKAGKVYLFEADLKWIEALEATFAPWREKVTIINKFVSDNDSNNVMKLDTFFGSGQSIDLIKTDAEGAEMEILEGGKELLTRSNTKIAITTYHRPDAESAVTDFLNKIGYKVVPTKGFMIFIYDSKCSDLYLRRGLIHALKESVN